MKSLALFPMFEKFFKRNRRDPLADAAPVAIETSEHAADDGLDEDPRSPEECCGITPGMSKPEIRERLAKLFRRYNRLASSLDGNSREEAEYMLDMIVQLRETHLE